MFLLRRVKWVLEEDVSAMEISDELSRAPDLYALSAIIRRAKEIAKAEGENVESESLDTIIAIYLYRRVVIEHIRKVLVTSSLVVALLIAILYAIHITYF